MDTFGSLILEIYRAARETPVNEYQDYVLGLVKSLVPFTSSRWGTFEAVDNGAITHCVHLQNELTDVIVDWESINRMDRLMHIVKANPGKAISIHSETFFAGSELAEMRDYARRSKHANSLCTTELAAKPGVQHGLTLYRADQHDHFNDSGVQLLERLFPHMVEALAHNRLLWLRQTGVAETVTEQGCSAIARRDGQVYFAGIGFSRLMREEWPDWKGNKLPDALHDALARSGGTGFSGVAATVSITCIGELIFLRATPSSPLSRLSPRESSIAGLYSQGLSHKEIASQLDLSPATVRNFIQRVFTKLEIKDKAELAFLIGRNGHLS